MGKRLYRMSCESDSTCAAPGLPLMPLLRAMRVSYVAFYFLLGVVLCMGGSVTAQTHEKVVLLATLPEKSTDKPLSRAKSDTLNRLLQCIFTGMEIQYKVYHIPWARAKRELTRSAIDGIFLTRLDAPDPGVKTKPIYLEKWFALSRLDNGASLSEQRIGVIRESDVENWLLTQGLKIHIRASSHEQLIAQFSANRFDVFVTDLDLLERVGSATEIIKNSRKVFVRYMAKGITFSTRFTENNPLFINEFNSKIKPCNPAVTRINSDEEAIIRHFVQRQVIEHYNKTMLATGADLAKVSLALSDKQIASRDVAWRLAIEEQQPSAFITSLLDNSLSVKLRTISQQSRGISEIFLTDSNGVLLATSSRLSDYFQGDEEKVMALSQQQTNVTDIEYDASTGDFISHYSTLLKTQHGDSLLLVVGVNLEYVFRDEDLFTTE